MSGGRVELGIGAGWFEDEHQAYGIPFPARRFDRLEEQLAIITGLWATGVGDTYSFVGEHYELRDSPALPKPVQSPRPPIIVGGHGAVRTPYLAARHADEFNVPFDGVEVCRMQYQRLDAACAEVGRDPSELERSVALVLCCGRDDAEVARRAAAIGRDPAERDGDLLVGTPSQLVDRLGQYAEAGATRCYLQTLDVHDLDHIELVASEVVPQLAAVRGSRSR
jgi:alkanesulfonate monooxygenase SsuD/methylene tetrahydromethanopterin reductase-like flavin-dependent oxidoreductase (luciferase family)